MIEPNTIHLGDCLEVMQDIADKSIDAIICDLPYGTTPCEWDSVINLDDLWKQYKRIIKHDGAIVLFAQQPFTTSLISSNLEMYKYNWIWVKENGTNFLNSHYQPIKIIEDIVVFGFGSTSPSSSTKLVYNPQMDYGGTPYRNKQGYRTTTSVIRNLKGTDVYSVSNGERYPTNLLFFQRDSEKVHPTQKPINLLRYLIRTYSDTGGVILDNCMGSGTTCVACIKEKRQYIGIELNKEYYDIAEKRLNKEKMQLTLF